MSDIAWRHLVDDGVLDEMASGIEAWAIAGRYRAIASAFRFPQRTAMATGDLSADGEGELLGTQLEAIATLLAQQAEVEDKVTLFRRNRLGGVLLSHEQVQPWIAQSKRAEPGADLLIEFVLPPDTVLSVGAEGISIDPPVTLARGLPYIRYRRPELAYTIPTDDWVHRIYVRLGGVLNELRELAESLSARYGWAPAHATTFVLTGLIPPRPGIRARAPVGALPAVARLELSIDLAITPAELASRYRALRSVLRPGKPRAISQRHAVLVAFIASRPNAEPWRSRMAAWNALWEPRQPKWSYTHVSNFQRDFAGARRRLLGGVSQSLSARSRTRQSS
jgi:hypothetical protein